MLSKCSNPSCGESFKYLDDGQLFRLETEPLTNLSEVKDPEYFWLCSSCCRRMTLRLNDDAKVMAVPLSNPSARGEGTHFVLLERRQGVLLSTIHFLRQPDKTEKNHEKAKAAHAG